MCIIYCKIVANHGEFCSNFGHGNEKPVEAICIFYIAYNKYLNFVTQVIGVLLCFQTNKVLGNYISTFTKFKLNSFLIVMFIHTALMLVMKFHSAMVLIMSTYSTVSVYGDVYESKARMY